MMYPKLFSELQVGDKFYIVYNKENLTQYYVIETIVDEIQLDKGGDTYNIYGKYRGIFIPSKDVNQIATNKALYHGYGFSIPNRFATTDKQLAEEICGLLSNALNNYKDIIKKSLGFD